MLGLPVVVDTPGFAVLGQRLAPALALGTHSEVRGRNADPARHMVGFTTDDITRDWAPAVPIICRGAARERRKLFGSLGCKRFDNGYVLQ